MQLLAAIKGAYDGALAGFRAALYRDPTGESKLSPAEPAPDKNHYVQVARPNREAGRTDNVALTAATMAILGMPGSALGTPAPATSSTLEAQVRETPSAPHDLPAVPETAERQDEVATSVPRAVPLPNDAPSPTLASAPSVQPVPTMLMHDSAIVIPRETMAPAPVTTAALPANHEVSNVITFPGAQTSEVPTVHAPAPSDAGKPSAAPPAEPIHHLTDIKAEMRALAEKEGDSDFGRYLRSLLGEDRETGEQSTLHTPLFRQAELFHDKGDDERVVEFGPDLDDTTGDYHV